MCPPGKFRQNDPAATECESCAPGTYQDALGQNSCKPCSPPDFFQDGTGQGRCRATRVCKDHEYESQLPTNTTNRVCLSHDVCESTQFEIAGGAATPTSDRQCQDHATCEANQWESVQPTGFRDRTCLNYTDCLDDQWETKAGGRHHDRKCTNHTTNYGSN